MTPLSQTMSPRPAPALGVDAANVPRVLRDLAQWVCWRFVHKGERWTKVPCNARSGLPVSVTEPASWVSFDEAVTAYNRAEYSGIGFVFTPSDPFVGVDLDGCLDERGVMAQQARGIIADLDTYYEISPSGTGVKAVLRGRKPVGAKCRSTLIPGMREVEIYDERRFFAITGRVLDGDLRPVQLRQQELEALCSRLWPKNGAAVAPVVHDKPNLLDSDDAILERAHRSKNGGKFARLWSGETGDYGGDDSRADLALCALLAFWTRNDRAAIDRLFRRSGLFRDKWERTDYREATITKGIERGGDNGALGEEVVQNQEEPGGAPPSAPGQGESQEVLLGPDEHRVADEAIALLSADPELYQRGGTLARIVRQGGEDSGVFRDPTSAIICMLPRPLLRERLARYCNLVRVNRDGVRVAAHPPGWLVSAIDARGSWPTIRKLKGISEVPVLREDGSIWQRRGHDPQTGVVFEPSVEFPELPCNAGIEEAKAAIGHLLEITRDFRFQSEHHQAAWLAALLTPLARSAFRGPAPLFLVDANVRGAGKGLLVQTISEVVTGRPMAVSTYSHEPEEMRKRVTAIAIAGDQMVVLDNLTGCFGNAVLDAALTTTRWRDRVLGRSEQVDLPLTTVWYATGNNVVVGADTGRRIIHIRLDVLEERPEDRKDFHNPDLIGWVRDRRPTLVVSTLTLLSAYCRAGKPTQDIAPMGSFEGWSRLVRGALVWAGQPDPLSGTRMFTENTDTGHEAIAQLLAALELMYPDHQGFVVTELIARLYPPDGIRTDDNQAAVMRTAIENMVGGSASRPPAARQLGNRLRSCRRRVVNGLYVDVCEGVRRAGGTVWRLCRTTSNAGSGETV